MDDVEAGDVAMQDTPGPEAPLESPSPLDRFGLAVNMELGVLTCTDCLTGLAPDEWKGHMSNRHANAFKSIKRGFPALHEALEPAIDAYNLKDPDAVRNQRPGRAPVKGIRVNTGFYCPVLVDGSACNKVVGTESSFSTHLSRDHTGSEKKPNPCERKMYTCEYQTVFLGSHRRYFLVRTGVVEGSTIGAYELFLQNFKSAAPLAEQGGMELETRELPALLRGTHWDIFVGPFRKSPKDVISLVEFPRSSEDPLEKLLHCLYDTCKAWFAKVYDIWKGSSGSIRRLLGMA